MSTVKGGLNKACSWWADAENDVPKSTGCGFNLGINECKTPSLMLVSTSPQFKYQALKSDWAMEIALRNEQIVRNMKRSQLSEWVLLYCSRQRKPPTLEIAAPHVQLCTSVLIFWWMALLYLWWVILINVAIYLVWLINRPDSWAFCAVAAAFDTVPLFSRPNMGHRCCLKEMKQPCSSWNLM